MPYHSIRLKVFKDLGSSPSKYYYEPLVLLDPRSIKSNVDRATGQVYVRLTIQMWDAEVEGQVLNWLKRLPGSQDVEDFCVQAMPYEEVRLVMRADSIASTSFRTPKYPTAYHRLDQSLQFYLICESKEMGDSVAESFKSDPAFAIQDLTLECASIAVSSTAEPHRKRPRVEDDAGTGTSVRSCTYLKVNVRNPDDLPTNGLSQDPEVLVLVDEQLNKKVEGLEENVKQLTAQFGGIGLMIKDLNEKMKEPADCRHAVLPVFSASGLLMGPLNGPMTYQGLDFAIDKTHGVFDASTGLFTATSAGLYHLFFFSGMSWLDKDAKRVCNTCVELRVDGKCKASSEVNCFGKNGTPGYNLSISAMVELKSGNVVGVFKTEGLLAMSESEGRDTFTRFSCVRLKE